MDGADREYPDDGRLFDSRSVCHRHGRTPAARDPLARSSTTGVHAAAVIRPLGPGDAQQLEAFLVRHADFSMFLRSNSRAAGLVYRGQPLEAEYVAAFDDDRIVAVAAHCWNDMLLVQAPVEVAAVARAAIGAAFDSMTNPFGPKALLLARQVSVLHDQGEFAEWDHAR